MLSIELNDLIEFAKTMGTTDVRRVNAIIDAQDRVLHRQKMTAEYSRMKEEAALQVFRLSRTGWTDF